jgi:hypothetical protein
MRRHICPISLLIAAMLMTLAFVLAGCQDVSGSDGAGDATSTSADAGAATTLPHLTTTTHAPGTTEAPTLVTNRYEQNDPKLHWLGPWTATGGADDSGGSLVYTEDTASSVSLKFSGVSISLVTRVGLALGEITATLDSGDPVTIDCYSDTPGYQQIIWFADPLPNTTHYLKLECAGTSNPASGGVGIYVDAFAITGTLLPWE